MKSCPSGHSSFSFLLIKSDLFEVVLSRTLKCLVDQTRHWISRAESLKLVRVFFLSFLLFPQVFQLSVSSFGVPYHEKQGLSPSRKRPLACLTLSFRPYTGMAAGDKILRRPMKDHDPVCFFHPPCEVYSSIMVKRVPCWTSANHTTRASSPRWPGNRLTLTLCYPPAQLRPSRAPYETFP